MLIGTQMIVKGHDFPNVTLVGVLAADLSLGAGDYRAGERTFQLLTQAVGRAGRGEQPGVAVIQTYQPDHYAVVHAAAQDYESFYQEEILYRQLGGYPPVLHLLAVQVYSSQEQSGKGLAEFLANRVRGRADAEKLAVLGPGAASVGKVNDVYRHVLYVKSDSYRKLVDVKDDLEKAMEGLQFTRENVQFDFDPMSFL